MKDGRKQSPAPPRTPLDCYKDFMRSFKAAFAEHLEIGGTVAEVLVGAGPCGRGSHSSTSHFNSSRCCHSNHPTYPAQSADVELQSGRV